MEEGALGVGSSLIYAPAFYAKTDELDRAGEGRGAVRRHVHLAHAQRGQPAARSRSTSCSRSRARRTFRAEIYHLKAAGEANWPKLDDGDREGRGRARRGPRRSPPTCTPTPPARPASTPRCRRGCRRAATRRGRRACRIRRFAQRVRARDDDAERRLGEPVAGGRRRKARCSSASRTRRCKPLTGKTLAEVAQARAASRPRRPRWTSSSRTAAACRSSTS